ncbi:MAG: 2-succinyl-6-hydroxy-2,4-cyclohexadiene-1-carboxylate synthase [Melioribacteraceae bacterium]|nr:2-succinyl-6-hydroxy-2,4-cyclohexadiene-1-carboxylate synthase [Melioribacteraceae bacterium]
MKLNIDGINFNILIDDSKISQNKIPILFIHGFTGSSDDWEFILNSIPSDFLPFAIDLIGHGKTDSPKDSKYYNCSSIVNQINSVITFFNFKKIILAGYSMGGRVALSYSLKHLEKVSALILESTTPGIEDVEEKKKRVEHDLILAETILNDGVENFIEYWFNTPLFSSLKTLNNFLQIIEKRKTNNPIGLANTLKSFSTGLMNSYWDKIGLLNVPVLLITGSRDKKYTEQNFIMKNYFKNAQHKIIEEATHNTHLEKPELFTNFVIEFLNKLKGSNEI